MNELKRYLIKIWYIGRNFVGSQRQPEKRTVEGELLKALKKAEYLTETQVSSFKAAARTDAGVHAKEAAFCFNSMEKIYIQRIESFLPDDIGIIGYQEVNLEFHPRWEVEMKEYKCIYVLKEGENPSLSLMKEALKFYEGNHDFKLFSKTDASKKNKLTNLTMNKASVANYDEDKQTLVFNFQSKSFLWQQIRRTIAFILKIGNGKANLEDLKAKLDPQSFNNPSIKRDKPIEPGGLILWKIDFPGTLNFNFEKKSSKKQNEFIKEFERNLHQQRSTMRLFLTED
ncbi:tRNA pseudouridine(38-40) synthase TruA [Promethearchaeum syntrophicum]|uniref:tRNA pseudouridine synthase A n=1 Tax=Promethearchaeum syntrophicum TaxID=2594042 RepID=A0A5B9D5G4_9ARCH|nr:tRNA pseudouridine(38-40) synthase TruA [Candidatus Prometheoarchaeum syntrophicum]QEE14226.1 tRNA pseudouridine synthase A [Candidatus Prometheoarchaeum syntrophicum]